jgi:post-segregation antitoxin (ccd killing protein)
MYTVRMARVNITVPDGIVSQARAAGLNVSRIASAALAAELDRLQKIAALDRYLNALADELGPISTEDQAEAAAWADRVIGPQQPTSTAPTRRCSA